MFGATPDYNQSFSHQDHEAPPSKEDVERLRHSVGSLETEIENLQEENRALRALTLQPLVKKYEQEIVGHIHRLRNAVRIEDEFHLKRLVAYDDHLEEMASFLEELLKGAREV